MIFHVSTARSVYVHEALMSELETVLNVPRTPLYPISSTAVSRKIKDCVRYLKTEDMGNISLYMNRY